MFTYNKDFYPTSPEVIERMLEGYSRFIYKGRILEPSAGKANILDYLFEKKLLSSHDKTYIDVCESDLNLQAILRSKQYRLVDSNFLNYFPEKHYSLIIMNPPFSEADKHLDHALNIRQGAELRCLYPTESLNNPYSQLRKSVIYKVKQMGGTIENLGSCFVDAERSTKVEVSLIVIPYDIKSYSSMFDDSNFESEQSKFTLDSNSLNNQLTRSDMIDSLIDRHNALRNSFKDLITAIQKINFYSKGFVKLYDRELFDDCRNSNLDQYYNNLCDLGKSKAWSSLVDCTEVSDKITSKVKKKFLSFVDTQKNVSFSRSNIEQLIDILLLNRNNLMKDCVEQVFDDITSHSKDNISFLEGWVTNKSWKINNKIIVPFIFKDSSTLSFKYYAREDDILDIEKVMCFLSGKNFKTIDSIVNRIKSKNLETGVWHESEFFEFKGFKKGTLHLKFKDKYILDRFNILASECKNWIGSGN